MSCNHLLNQDLQDFEDFLIGVVDSNGACRSLRITFSLAIFYLGGNNHFILYLNAFHQCDHRIDEKKVIKVTIFYLHLTQTRDVIVHPALSCNTPLNQDLQDFEDFLIGFVDSNGACCSMRITFSLAIFLNWRLIVPLLCNPLTFRRCDHRSDEKSN